MLTKFFEALYHKVFVNIVVKRSSTDVYIELCSKNGIIESAENSFETLTLTKDMIEFILSYTKESPYFYISILDISIEQGAFPTCSKNRLSYFYDVSSSEHKCSNDSWTYYTSKTDLYEIEKKYHKVGLDFIFSPFTLLSNFFKDKISAHIAMYILIQDSFISLSVFENGLLLYAEQLDMQTSGESDDVLLSQDMSGDDDVSLDDGIDLEDIDVVDEMEDLDDFGDIEDLDSLEEIDEFSENQDIEEEFYEADEPIVESDESNFNEDYQRFTLIQSALGHYYNDDKYEGKFVENVYIADGVGVSNDLKRYLEEEMYLNVYVRHAELGMELSNLAKMELNS